MPARASEEAEAVARGSRRSDAPARRRGARFQKLRLAQQKERQACIRGGKLQSLAQSQIELVDDAGDGGRRARMQRFLQSPQGFMAMRCLDQDQAARIEAERIEAMAVGTAVSAQPIGRHDEDERPAIGRFPLSLWGCALHDRPLPGGRRKEEPGTSANEKCREEAEGGWRCAFIGHDFMQSPASQTALRQATIKSR